MPDLSVFLPRTLHDLMAPALEGREAHKTVRGTVLFCDIAGFTPLTEALSVIGREGAEELTRLINAYFSTMIGIVEEAGGDVLRFGGDSMTLFFPGEARGQALRAAERMMAAMAGFEAVQTRAGVFGLSIKVGASCGEVLLGLVGDEETGFDYYAAGPPLDESAEAEHRAEPGWIVGHPALWSDVPLGLETAPLADGFRRIAKVTGAPAPVAIPSQRPPDALFQRLIPRHLAERAGGGVPGEHRGTAVLFLTFDGVSIGTNDETAPSTHRSLDGLYALFASTARLYGGLVNKLDMGDKGCKALLLFGSPYAIENREEMAVRAALDLLSNAELHPEVRLRIGITSAPLFSGPVGGEFRREFTVIGDGINLAARLMQAALPGQVICDAAVVAKAAESLRFNALPSIQVKGKQELVAVFSPAGEADLEWVKTQDLIGRDDVCAELREYLTGESGRPVCLAGEPGLGKSALIEWAAAEAKAKGLSSVRVPLGPYSQDRPYAAWRGVVRSVLGLGKNDTGEKVRRARDEALAKEPSGFRPLVDPLLDLPEEKSAALRNLSPQEKKDLTFSILGRLLAASGLRAIFLDGLQWADPLSLELLAFLFVGQVPTSWRIVAALRPGNPEADRATSGMTLIALKPLATGDLESLLERVHGLTEVQPSVSEWFTSRCKGNPAVLSALFAALDSAGLVQRFESVTRVDSDRLFATSFPETLEGLYMARVDHLPRAERETLQCASILGASVSVNLLLKITETCESELNNALSRLEAGGFLRLDTWGARPYYRFADPLLAEAVYGSLPFALKRSGHLKLAQFLEPSAEKVPKLWPTLAYHFEQGDEKDKAKTYHRLAGRAAAARFDNVTALKHLEYVTAQLDLSAEDVEDAFTLMDAYGALGRWVNAKSLLGCLAFEEKKLTSPHQARLQNYLAQDLAFRGEWEGAEAVLHKGVALSQKAGDVLLEAKGYVNLVGRVYGPTGQLEKAKLVLEKALALPEGPGQEAVRATAAMNLGMVFWHLGKLGSAKASFHRAFSEAFKARLMLQQGMVANNLSAVLYEGGQFSEAGEWGKKALDTMGTFVIRGLVQLAKYNLALAQIASGKANQVTQILKDVDSRAQSYGEFQVQAQAKQGLSQASAFLGETASSLTLARQSLVIFRRLENGRDYRFRLLDVGNLFHALNAPEGARAFWRENEVASFLQETPSDPLAEPGLDRIKGWMSGKKAWQSEPERFLAEARHASAEERLQRLLWVAEAYAEAKHSDESAAVMPRVQMALAVWPYFDCRLRVLRLQAIFQGRLDNAQGRQARLLLSRCMGGVWGLRLLCVLWQQEKGKAAARRRRKKALERLAYFREHSPEWAWGKLSTFPEIASLISGPQMRSPRSKTSSYGHSTL